MNLQNIALQRIYNQQIAHKKFNKADEIATWLGAIQSQDYASAKHAIGLRIPDATEMTVEKAINNRTIVRTWSLRGTLHIMAAKDIHWVLDLLAPGIISRTRSRFRQLELDETTLLKTNQLLVKAMDGGKQLTREKIFDILEQHGFSTKGQRGLHILYRAALDKLICHGSMQGKQFTHTLLDEWIPGTKILKREEALYEVAKRYFISHGPATLHDFVWWSGLSVTDSKAALESAKSDLKTEMIDGKTYWMPLDIPDEIETDASSLYLLPAFDEYIIGYADRSIVLHPDHSKHVISNNGIFFPTIIMNGQVVGTWKRTFKKDTVIIEANPFALISKDQQNAISESAINYGRFVEMPVVINY